MIEYAFSVYDLELFLLIMVRVTCFVHTVPFFGMKDIPAMVRIALSIFVSMLLYEAVTPAERIVYSTLLDYLMIVMKEAVTGLLIGFSANICMSIVNFAGSIADMEVGLSMVTLMDPASQQAASITGVLYQYVLMLMMIATGMHRYLMAALADTFVLIPVNGAVFRGDALLSCVIDFLVEYVIIGFRIILPIFCSILLLNAVLGVLAKVSPQMNMFAVGIQLKVLVGLSIIWITVGMLPEAADMIFQEMKRMIVSFAETMQ